ncbi:MAG: type 1 fimbrial protein [Spirochaetales bacterium]|nr:type 1 fimbrial protein [Spirochaetales bacterium]
MRRIISLVLIFFIIALMAGSATEQEAIDNVISYAAAAAAYLEEQGYYIEVPENAGQVFYLEKGQYIKIDGTFYSGTNYVIVASGGSNATDIDIEVYDEKWSLIFDGNTDGIDTDVILTPGYTAEMHVAIKLTATKAGAKGAYVGFLLFYVSKGK